MCGICGTIGFKSSDIVEEMNKRLSYRGPDDMGLWRNNWVCLGNRRLSIIGLAKTGHQPMSNEDGTLWITFNGEIYNFKALKEELEKKGHKFKSKTDTEVVIHLYEEHKERCVDFLRGMFSFGIWDTKRKRLFIARDRLGIKPLFYFHKNDKFIFSSELKAIMATGIPEKKIETKAIHDYFRLGSVCAPYSMIKNVFQLLPAHYLIFENNELIIKRYWKLDLTNVPNEHKTEKEYISDINSILNEVVKIRLISDVPLGVFLSGGIDSSALTALASKHTASLKTFSVIFKEEQYDERQFSDKMASEFATEHKQIMLHESDILEELPKIFKAMDQPSIDGFNTFIISKAAKKAGLKVALSGLGSDELFAGYSLFRLLPKMHNALAVTKHFPDGVKNSFFNFLKQFAGTRRSLKLFYSIFKCNSLHDLYLLQRTVFLPYEICRIVPVADKQVAQSTIEFRKEAPDPINQLSFLDLNGYLQNTLLQDTDKMSMANSLEVRVPFLDHTLVEEMFKIPGCHKTGKDYPKRLLIKSVGNILPKEIYNRPKMGFVFPFEKWLKGALKDYCADRFSKSTLNKISILDQNAIDSIWTAFLNGSALYNYSSVLAILSFVNWYENNI